MMGGDGSRRGLFYAKDRIRTGDRIYCDDLFDEPRVITGVHPEKLLSGNVSHWIAEMLPESQWERQNRPQPLLTPLPDRARINVGSVDRSVQQFQNQSGNLDGVMRELDAIREAIERLAIGTNNRRGGQRQQIRLELQRSKPEKGRVWELLGRLNTVSGLGEKIAKVSPLVERLFDQF